MLFPDWYPDRVAPPCEVPLQSPRQRLCQLPEPTHPLPVWPALEAVDAPPGEAQGTQGPRDVGRGSGGFRRPAARPRTWCRSQDSCPVTLRPHARGGGRGHFRGHGPHGPSLRPQSAPLFPCRVCHAPFPARHTPFPRPLRVGPLSFWPNVPNACAPPPPGGPQGVSQFPAVV